MKKVTYIFLGLVGAAFFSCKEKKSDQTGSTVTQQSNTVTKYAEGFKVHMLGRSKLVEVTYPFQGATSGYKYLLVPRGEQIPTHDAETRVIQIPLRSLVSTSTTHIPLL